MFESVKRKAPRGVVIGADKALEKRLATILSKVASKTKIKVRTFTKSEAEGVECVPTLWQEFDDVLSGKIDDETLTTIGGTGRGLPRGKIIEIYGNESVGKTTLALQMIAAYQKAHKISALIDVEYAFDPKYTKKLGVDVPHLIKHQPDSAEEALDLTLELARQGVDLIVVDSVSALDPKDEQDRKTGKTIPGKQASLMSGALRKLTRVCGRSGSTVIFLNQIRVAIGVMFGNPERTSGGNALKFYSSIRIDLRKVKVLKIKNTATGIIVRGKTVKNKVAPPHREVYFKFKFGKGITSASSILE